MAPDTRLSPGPERNARPQARWVPSPCLETPILKRVYGTLKVFRPRPACSSFQGPEVSAPNHPTQSHNNKGRTSRLFPPPFWMIPVLYLDVSSPPKKGRERRDGDRGRQVSSRSEKKVGERAGYSKEIERNPEKKTRIRSVK